MKCCTSTVRLWGGWILPMLPIEKPPRHHAQELRLPSNPLQQCTLCNVEVLRQPFQTERCIRGLLLLLPRLARKQQVSGKKMPETLQASAQHQKFCHGLPRRRNCTHPVDTACSWSGQSVSVSPLLQSASGTASVSSVVHRQCACGRVDTSNASHRKTSKTPCPRPPPPSNPLQQRTLCNVEVLRQPFQTERCIRGLLLLLPRLARKQQVSGKKMPETLQASA